MTARGRSARRRLLPALAVVLAGESFLSPNAKAPEAIPYRRGPAMATPVAAPTPAPPDDGAGTPGQPTGVSPGEAPR